MSASQASPEERYLGLRPVPIDQIDTDPENPRQIFPQEELDRLAESIAKEGVLVPLVVYQKPDGRYTLVDGERRYRCARELGLAEVPVVLIREMDRREHLLQMFNIHLVREAWQDMPTAEALGRLINETGVTEERQLSDMTGLSTERIKRLRHALQLPEEYQRYIREHIIPLNWFWELKRNVIEPLAKHRVALWEKYGAERITTSFVEKRLAGLIPDTVGLRDVRPIITLAAKDAGDPAKPSVLDATLEGLIEDPSQTIEQAYEDSVQIMVETDKLERRTNNMLRSFQRLLDRARNAEERQRVTRIGTEFVKALRTLLG